MTSKGQPQGRSLLIRELPSQLLAGVIRRHQPGMQVIVPTIAAGQCLRASIPSVTMTLTLAQWSRKLLEASGLRALKPYERLPFLRDAMTGLEFEYLQPIRERPATLQHLLQLIVEFQHAYIDPQTLLRLAAPGREADAARSYAAFVEHCRVMGTYDGTAAEFWAGNLEALPYDTAIVHGFGYFDLAQLHFLDRVMGEGSLVTLPLMPPRVVCMHRTRAALVRLGFQEVV